MTEWAMAIDLDRCTGCEACVVACREENNVPVSGPEATEHGRATEWIRIERYMEGTFPNVRMRFKPVLCVHCDDAPCVKVCPVSATYETDDGLNAQIQRWRQIHDLGRQHHRAVATVDLSIKNNLPVRWMHPSSRPAGG